MEASPFVSVKRIERPVETHLGTVFQFEKEHKTTLGEVERAIDSAVQQIRETESDPIAVGVGTEERVDLLCLVPENTGDEELEKVVLALSSITLEMLECKEIGQREYYAPLALFGDVPHGCPPRSMDEDGDLELQLGRTMPMLLRLFHFGQRCNEAFKNAMHQLISLMSTQGKLREYFAHGRLDPVYSAMADLLQVLITIDVLVDSNEALKDAWNKYTTLRQMIASSQSRFEVSEAEMQALTENIAQLEPRLSPFGFFRECIEQQFDGDMYGGGSCQTRRAGLLKQQVSDYVLAFVESILKTSETHSEIDYPQRLGGTLGLYVLMRVALSSPGEVPDKDLFKKVWKTQERLPLVPLFGVAVLRTNIFINLFAPPSINPKKLVPKDPVAATQDAARKVSDDFEKAVTARYITLESWLTRAEMAFGPSSKPVEKHMMARAKVVLEGVMLTYYTREILTTFLILLRTTKMPIRKRHISLISKCVEILKVMQFYFQARASEIAKSKAHMIRIHASRLFALVSQEWGSRKTFKPGKDISMAPVLSGIEYLMQRTETYPLGRRLILKLYFTCLRRKHSLAKDTELDQAEHALWELSTLNDAARIIHEQSDTRFLYWFQDLLPPILQFLRSDNIQATRLPYVITAFSDVEPMLLRAVHLDPDATFPSELQSGGWGPEEASPEDEKANLATGFERMLLQTLHSEIISPTQHAVEEDLRLHIHSVHLPDYPTPDPKDPRYVKPNGTFLHMAPLRVFRKLINIKEQVVHHMERSFYDLTTVALHDWKTYSEMASLAADKYGLQLEDNHLPMGCLDQGLDILQIMRNIRVFVGLYNYNLNQQLFVEKRAVKGAKHLNVVSIDSICASIRQHGTGMINTTVNQAYRFLSQHFQIFNHFLNDDYIRSWLVRDRQWFKANHKKNHNMFPYERARALAKDIRSLGVDKDGMTFLDKFRQLITEIGNALGYVRMVRSAGMHHNSDAVKFIPDLSDIIKFEQAAKGELVYEEDEDQPAEVEVKPLSSASIKAGKTLDDVLSNLVNNFSEGVDYFRYFVQAFETALVKKNKQTEHLKNFFFFVPALTVSYIDAIRAAKDCMDKTIRGKEAYFTDDGFAIGIAYILAILNQTKHFQTLHWWDSVRSYTGAQLQACKEEEETLRRQKVPKARLDENAYTFKRFSSIQREFDQLMYSYSGAKIFFKDDEDDKFKQKKRHQRGGEESKEESKGEGGGGGGGGGGGSSEATPALPAPPSASSAPAPAPAPAGGPPPAAPTSAPPPPPSGLPPPPSGVTPNFPPPPTSLGNVGPPPPPPRPPQ